MGFETRGLETVDLDDIDLVTREQFQKFAGTELGQDVIASVTAQIKEDNPNVDDISDRDMHHTLFDLSSTQKVYSDTKPVNHEKMMEHTNSGWGLDGMLDSVKDFIGESIVSMGGDKDMSVGDAINAGVGVAAKAGVGVVVNHVQNEGATGLMNDDLQSSHDKVQEAEAKAGVTQPVPDAPGGM